MGVVSRATTSPIEQLEIGDLLFDPGWRSRTGACLDEGRRQRAVKERMLCLPTSPMLGIEQMDALDAVEAGTRRAGENQGQRFRLKFAHYKISSASDDIGGLGAKPPVPKRHAACQDRELSESSPPPMNSKLNRDAVTLRHSDRPSTLPSTAIMNALRTRALGQVGLRSVYARPAATRTYASSSPSSAVDAEKESGVLQKGAKRDPELYILLAIMSGAFGLAGWYFARKPTSSSSESKVSMKEGSMPWQAEAGSADSKYQYHPGGDTSKAPKDAPSALNTVIVPNVNLPKSLHDQFNKWGKDGY